MSQTGGKAKTCPFCGESILATAIKCRYCGEFLDGRSRDVVTATVVPPTPAETLRRNAAGNPFHEQDVDTELLYRGRPSLAALIGPILKTTLVLVVVWILCAYPLDRLETDARKAGLPDRMVDSLVEIVAQPDVELALGYRLHAGAIITALALLGLLWKIIKLKCISYRVTNDRIEDESGVFSRRLDNLDLFRITDQRLRRSLLDRLLGIGTVSIYTSDRTSPTFYFYKIRRPRRLYDILKKASLVADRRRGVVHME